MINYYLLTKPGIVFGNLITVGAGFLLASKGHIDFKLFLSVLFGLGFIMASSCILNNDINRETDKKMERTKNRSLVTGAISRKNASILAIFLGSMGGLILFFGTNLLTLSIATIGFFVYVVLYSFWKCKTLYGTAIGSIAGAIPPVVGYTAVSNQLDIGAFILFAILVFWQMPHFFAIAIYHFEDYAKAEMPLLPIKKGMFRTKIHMLLYIFCFGITASLLTYFGLTGSLTLSFIIFCSLAWVMLCLKGFMKGNDQLWGRQMFALSLVIIMILCVVIPLDVTL